MTYAATSTSSNDATHRAAQKECGAPNSPISSDHRVRKPRAATHQAGR